MSSEMRECPFCGNHPRSGWQGAGVPGMDDCGYWGIDCCNAFAHADTEAEALAQWNRRSDAPNGSWLWCKLMDFCQKRRFPPAEFNDLFAIVTEAHELNNRALLARTEAGAKCDHAWQPDSDVMNARYCPKCDVTQTIPKKTTHPQDASGDAEVLTAHGIKALDRCCGELRKFIELAGDYDLDEMSVQALQTAIESMEMRKAAAMQAKEAAE